MTTVTINPSGHFPARSVWFSVG
ncbi:MAG: hypothetical protein JWM76_1344, partial [Pseudonocardiales bacterium]|nr:hypothetical protein [Pseudonocardiales bacterium]